MGHRRIVDRSLESLMNLVGQPIASPAVQLVVAEDRMGLSTEPDLEEGEPPRGYFSCPSGGYELSHTDGRVNTLFVYSVANNEFQPFQGALVAGLSAESTRADVRRALGEPTHSGEPTTIAILGRMGVWDRFDGNSLCLHFAYTDPEQRLRQITVMAANAAP